MRIASLAAVLVIVLAASALAALTASRGAPQYPAAPLRPHVAVGEIRLLVKSPEPAGATLAEAARSRYGRVDALTEVRVAPLPFADGAIVTATAIRWN